MSRNSYRVLTIAKEPFIIFDNKNHQYSGLLIDLLNEVARTLNFTYSIALESEEQYGYENNQGSWNGIIGELVAGRADVGLAALSLTSERARVVDFTDPIYPSTGLSVLMQKPIKPTVLFRFFKVLNIKVWLCIAASYFFTSVLFWSFDVWSPYSYRNRRKTEEDQTGSEEYYEGRKVFSLKESLWFCLTSLTPQGGGEAPKNYSSRLVATVWWLFGFIIIASYTANMAAFLTLSRFDRTIDTFDDLLAHYKYTYTAVKHSEASRYFQRRKNIEFKLYDAWKALTFNDKLTPFEKAQLAVWEYPLGDQYNKINAAVTYHNMVKDLKDGLEKFKTKHSKFALITETTDVKFQVMINCTLKEVGTEFSKKPYAIALRKNSPLTEQFNAVIRNLIKKRWLKKNKEKWWDKNPKRKNCYNMDEKSVGILIENIGGLFITILIGIAIAFITMAFEYLYLRVCYKKIKKAANKRAKKNSEADDNDHKRERKSCISK